MKKLLFFIAIFCQLQANSQNISFAGTGLSTVKVDNLTKGITITLNAGEILTLSATTNISQVENKESSEMKIYPNPMIDKSTLQIFPPAAGNAIITIYEISGKKVAQIKTYVENYPQEFRLSGIKRGLYLINIKGNTYQSSGKLLCIGKSNGTTSIEKVGKNIQAVEEKTSKADYKGIQDAFVMLYSTGDKLKFTGTSGTNTTIITARTITQDTTITFTFIACTDSDGNNYPVVQIGTQVWMGENLKTTKYSDGTNIPLVINDTAWTILTNPGYCWCNNNEATYKNTYGAYYNWYAVNTGKLCPTGWFVPTDTEWTTLAEYLDGANVAGGKLKEPGTAHWIYPNNEATNESGFTALPGGFRHYKDSTFLGLGSYRTFVGVGSFGDWWSSTKTSATSAYSRGMIYNYNGVDRSSSDVKFGFSIRCVRDIIIETEAAINDTLVLCYTKLYDYIELAYLFDAVYANKVSAPDSSWTEIYEHTQTQSSNSEKILMLWSKAYDIIFKTNLIIRSSEIVISDQGTQNKIIAQAKAIRAYLFYNLLIWFGEIPLETEISQSLNPRNTIEDVLVQINQDATWASQSLPASWPASEKFKIPQSFAKGLLARAYMYSKKYNEALSPTQQIINSGLYTLSADTNNFTSVNGEIFWGFEKRNNTEFNDFFNKGYYVPGMRYTESYLTSAEATFNSGNTASAVYYSNLLNARRGKPMVTSLTTDVIFQHWITELAREGSTFITLKRFDLALSVVQNYPFKLLLPVPLPYINKNPYLTQNPGY